MNLDSSKVDGLMFDTEFNPKRRDDGELDIDALTEMHVWFRKSFMGRVVRSVHNGGEHGTSFYFWKYFPNGAAKGLAPVAEAMAASGQGWIGMPHPFEPVEQIFGRLE